MPANSTPPTDSPGPVTLKNLAIAAVAVTVIVLFPDVFLLLLRSFEGTTDEGVLVDPVSVNDQINTAIQQRIDFSKSLFQTGTLLLAGLWGLVFADKDSTYDLRKDWRKLCLLLLATLSLIGSFFAHFRFVWEITSMLGSATNGMIPEIESVDIIGRALFLQMANVILGAVIAVVVILTIRCSGTRD